jgi:hypothetical protein
MKLLMIAISMSWSCGAFAYNCWDYSSRAVSQNRAQKSLSCGFAGARWQTNWQAHFDWCGTVDINIAANEDRAREGGLGACLDRPSFIEDCAYYGARAVRQFQASQALGCGFGGARWQGNYASHQGWCAGGATYQDINSEDAARRNGLKLCVFR